MKTKVNGQSPLKQTEVDTSKIDNMYWTLRTLLPRFNAPNTRIIFN